MASQNTFKVACPHCGSSIRVPLQLSGKQSDCPGCKQRIAIPQIKAASLVAEIIEPPLLPPPLPQPSPIQSNPTKFVIAADTNAFAGMDDAPEEYEEDRPQDRRRLEPHRGTAILVMGILGIFVMPIIFGPIAWIWANEDLEKMRRGKMDPEGKGNTEAGKVMGIISTLLALCVIGFFFLYCGGIFVILGIAGSQLPDTSDRQMSEDRRSWPRLESRRVRNGHTRIRFLFAVGCVIACLRNAGDKKCLPPVITLVIPAEPAALVSLS